MVTPILSRSIWKYFFKHPWVIMLSIIGVSIGVAVVVSIDIANTSSQKAFELSVKNLTGTATHQISGSHLGMDEDIYVDLKLDFPEIESTPVVKGYVVLEGETVQLIGMDFFSSSYMTGEMAGILNKSALDLLIEPNTVFIPRTMGERLGISTGDTVTISIAGEDVGIKVVDYIGKENDSALDGIIAADISTAQELMDKEGLIDSISLVITQDDEDDLTAIQEWLPEGTTLVSTSASNESTLKITEAFQTNLTAMSMLALLVGMFLIYNTMTFSVLQRRGLLGSLRVLGVTRREVFTEVLIEAFIIGAIGTTLGVFLGIVLGQSMVSLVTRTIDDLYFTLTVTTFDLSAGIFIKGVLLGIITSMVAAFIPALEAAASRPQIVRFRSVMESLAHRLLPKITLAGILMMAVSFAILFLSKTSLIAGFASLFLLVIGFALCVPVIAEFISKYLAIFMNKVGSKTSVLYKMAAAGIAASISRTGTAIAAMSVAISVVVGMGIMIESFRTTVDQWLEQAIQADIYVNTIENVSSTAENPVPDDIVTAINSLDGIEAIKSLKTVYLQTGYGITEVDVITPVAQCRTEYRLKSGDEFGAWQSLTDGESIYISEPYAHKHNISAGDTIAFTTSKGTQDIEVSGIYYDYSSDSGKIIMPQSMYIEYWNDSTVASIGLYLENDDDKETVMNMVRTVVSGRPGITITDSLSIRNAALDVFDQTFLITRVLEFLAIIVAFIGILSALMAYQLEKIKEIGILRATGVTPRQIWGMTSLQTGLMGAISGILAIPLGIVMSVILIQVINIRSFGWSIFMSISAGTIIEALAIAITAALLASVYPAWKMSRISPAEALREE
jgi:putative ABC transport system permease protein